MPKKVPFVPKPAIAKLPLAIRKDLRDNYDSKKEEWESEINEIVGTESFKLNINPNEVWPYAEEGATNAGSLLARYVEGFISGLKSFVSTYGDQGKADFKATVTQSELTVCVHESGDDAPDYINVDIKDGVFRILFKPSGLGYNQSSLYDSTFVKALDSVDKGGFSLKAKNSIESKWDENVEELTKEIATILNIPDIVLDPNFEEVYAALKAAKKDNDWEASFGNAVYAYFDDGLKSQLKWQGFPEDELLQEGFAEGVPSKTIKLRVVPKLSNKNLYYNEPIIEDDILYLQTLPDQWYTNVSEIGAKIVNLL